MADDTAMKDLDRADAYLFDLPTAQIATQPAAERPASRLLHLTPDGPVDRVFRDIETLLAPGDLLVVNDARVAPVRLHARRATGGAVEVFVLGFGEEGRWDDVDAAWVCFTRSNKKLRAGERLTGPGFEVEIVSPAAPDTPARVRLLGGEPWTVLESKGALPLPPYITQRRGELGEAVETEADRTRYQTVYADRSGAVAAPTAGLHFDLPLLDRLAARGVRRASVTLWVGAGTFAPVRADRLSEHTLHLEHYEVPSATADAIAETRANGGRVVAVGTTVVRTLEAAAQDGALRPGPGSTRLFVRPGYRFRVVDALITNFHLPSSTLLALVAAFGGYEEVMAAYRHAVDAGYRFYSYGDAMFLPTPFPREDAP